MTLTRNDTKNPIAILEKASKIAIVKPNETTVIFRTKDGQCITAPLEFEGQRAFARLFEYGPKGTIEILAKERLELDVRFLEKMNPAHGADFLYKKEPSLPDPEKN